MNTYLRALDQHIGQARQSILDGLQRASLLKKASEQESRQALLTQSARRSFLREMDAALSEICAD